MGSTSHIIFRAAFVKKMMREVGSIESLAFLSTKNHFDTWLTTPSFFNEHLCRQNHQIFVFNTVEQAVNLLSCWLFIYNSTLLLLSLPPKTTDNKRQLQPDC